jgi:hypothetical protein
MAEEKKSPNLKDRLKKTQMGTGAPAGAPIAPPGGMAAPVMPPVSAPVGADGIAPPVVAPPAAGGGVLPGIPGIPGLGGSVAPPPFVQQQQAAEAAAARARAAAADPFSAAAPAAAAPQQLVIQLDGKDVADSEVGRTKTGTIVAVALTAVVALGAGYAIGGMVETKNQERQTISAVGGVRQEVMRLGDVINQMKQHVDHAAEVGNIQVTRGEGDEGGAQQAAPTHPPEIDASLIEWFRSQPGDPPFTADVYAGRVGRLRSVVVSKLTLVTLQFTQAWQLLGQHAQRTNVPNVTAALGAANPQNNELSRMLVTFGRSSADAPPFAMLVSLGGPPAANGAVPITGAGIPAGQTRTPYTGAEPITPQNITTFAIPVAPGQGLAAQALAAAVLPWRQYQQRISELKQLIDNLTQNHSQLLEALQGRSGS